MRDTGTEMTENTRMQICSAHNVHDMTSCMSHRSAKVVIIFCRDKNCCHLYSLILQVQKESVRCQTEMQDMSR